MLTWIDEPPGRLMPRGQLLEIDLLQGGSWIPFAWDDQPDVVVEALGKPKGSGQQWRVIVQRSTAGMTLRLRVLPRSKGAPVRFASQQIEGCA
jgi:hypothetical protein